MKARTKTYVMYRIPTFDGSAVCWVHCFPQQKWELEKKTNKVVLTRKGIDLEIPKEEFQKNWVVIESEVQP